MRRPGGRRSGQVTAALSVALVLLSACASGADSDPSRGGPTRPQRTTATDQPETTPSTSPTQTPTSRKPVTIAFAGDVHFASFLAQRLDDPATAIGPMAQVLAGADIAMVNLESAVTTRGVAQSKQYVFRAPPVAFDALRDGGVDVVTMANNHALDYGPVSVPDALAAATAAHLPVVGIGENADQAFAPWITTVRGQRIAFLGATAVLDSDLVTSWSATDSQPGVATALDGDNARLVQAVRAVRPHVDTVVVDLHYGSDQQTCPTDIQRGLVADLVAAGADVIVGQHAHVLLGGGFAGSTYVDYGLGNFEFYVDTGAEGQTGVLVLTLGARHVTSAKWVPGVIRDGVPQPLTGRDATTAHDSWSDLRACTGLTSEPAPAAR